MSPLDRIAYEVMGQFPQNITEPETVWLPDAGRPHEAMDAEALPIIVPAI